MVALAALLFLAQSAPPADLTKLLAYAGQPHSAIRVVYEGTFALEGHLAKPHDTQSYETRLTLLADAGDRARLDWETWPPGHEDQRDLDTTLIVGPRVWRRLEASQPFTESSGKSAALLRARVEALAPWRTLARIRLAPERCSVVGAEALTWSDSAELGGFPRRFTWNAASRDLETVTRAFAHPRLGDARDEIRYRAFEDRGGIKLPADLSLREFDGDDVLLASPGSFELRLKQVTPDAAVAQELDAPADARPAQTATEAGPISIAHEELEAGLHSFAAKDLDGRTYVVEFADHLLAIDAPLSSAVGERMLETIRERFPRKPLRYVLFGHFHPHYTGGLRAFLAEGAKVVAPSGCAAFAAEIAARPFTLEPDAWARLGRAPEIESFAGTRVFEDAQRRLEAIDIGKKSGHTDEYVVFYLPRTHTLLQDDIGWSTTSAGKPRFGARSRGLYEALRERGLEVQTLWQSWPVASPRPSLGFAEFERGVQAGR